MEVSIDQFLKTGAIGNLHLGMTADEVRDLLGLPDDVGGTSRRHPRPSIYVYGSIELFSRSRPAQCHGLWWYAHRGVFRLRADEGGGQFLLPGIQRPEVEARLKSAALLFECPPHREEIAPTLVLASGVTAVFNEDGSLYVVAAFER